MNLEDESFPVDEFIDELEFSPLAISVQRFQFPHYQREQRLQQQRQQQQQQQLQQSHEQQHENNVATTKATITATTTVATTSSSSEPNLSTESNQESRPSSVLSGKTSVSDADDNGIKHTEFALDRPQTKAISYQDIHSEYTKRRFKHVTSKVGQYIANMKADDQKRREAKFERHRSLPDTLSGSDALLNAADQKRSTMRYSVDELHHAGNGNSSNSDADGDLESAANTSATTSASAATSNNNNNSDGRHETSDNTSGGDFIDKQTFALLLHEKERIQSYSEYLQTKLDEKSSENLRLKRNVDYMRIELSNCQDKLKMREKANAKSRLPMFLTQLKLSKATQTDLKTPSPLLPLRDLYVTPDTPDANNNNNNNSIDGATSTVNASKTGQKTVATIQPLSLNFSNIAELDASGSDTSGGVLRQRTNSNATAQNKPNNNINMMTNENNTIKNNKKTNSNNNNNTNNRTKSKNRKNNSRSSSDSAIDIESAEVSSSSKLRSKQQQKLERNLNAIHSTQSLGRAEEFIYYDKRTGRYATLQALNVGTETKSTGTTTPRTPAYDENNESTQTNELSSGCRKTKKHQSLRRRWLRFFGYCTRCSDSHALDNSVALQQTYTQIPLLEKSIENHCRNIR